MKTHISYLGLSLCIAQPAFANETHNLATQTPTSELISKLHQPVVEHCLQDELLAIEDSTVRGLEAFECGDELFEFQYNSLDGVGARVNRRLRFTRVPRADLNGPQQWMNHFPARETGPNAEACTHCHSTPPTGAGPAGLNVVRDPKRTGVVAQFITRNTPHLMGSGAIQLLAEEMTTELKTAARRGQEQACELGYPSRVHLTAKDVSFGEVLISCNGQLIDKKLTGIDADLIVRPFQWKGSVSSLRVFNREASHAELGMQPVELVGDDTDGDFDGVMNEFGVGDMTAMTIYVAGQARPVTKIELDDLGLMGILEDGEPLTHEERAAITLGENVFESIGCDRCHKPQMVLNNPIYSQPSRHPDYRDPVFPGGQDPVTRGVDINNPVEFDLTKDQPDNVFVADGQEVRLGNLKTLADGKAVVQLYGDLKRHNMGRRLKEPVDETGTGASVWMTKELWGVGSTAPYLHDGRATTLTEAILEHGGEALFSRVRFIQLAEEEQAALIAFLNNLILIKVE